MATIPTLRAVSGRVALLLALVVTALLVVVPAAAAHDGPGRPPGGGLQLAADALVANGQPGAVVYSRAGGRVDRVAAGLADTATGRPMAVGDRVHIGSITKSFVATVVLQLVAEHRLSLDDTVQRWLPGVVDAPGYDGRRITVGQLLRQTSGLREYLDDPRFATFEGLGRTWSPRELVRAALRIGPPLSGWHYANTNYVLAGLVVEAVTHHPAAWEVQHRIIAPLRLTSTSFPLTDPTMPAPFAHGYFTPYGDVTTAVNPSAAWTAGAMISTVTDVATFYRQLFTGRLLPPAQLRQLTAAIPVDDQGLFPERYGAGVYRVDLPCGPAWGHDGGYPGGFRSYAFTSPDGARQAVVTVNDFGVSDGPDNPAYRAALQHAIAVAFCG